MHSELVEVFGLDPDVLHLNHGAFGCAPIPVRRAAEAWRDRADRNPHRFNGSELPALISAARQRAADFLGVAPEATGLVRNVSEGVSSVLGSLGLQPGDEILLGSHGYGAVRIAAENWASRSDAAVRTAEFDLAASSDEIVAAYAAQAGPRTKLVVVDQITSPTAMVLPVAAIAEAVDAPVLADAAHVPGTIDTDIAGLGVGYWVGNLHKWCHTPRGTGVLWTREDLRSTTYPAVLSWQVPDGYAAAFGHPGTWDYSGWLALGDGLDFWTSLGGWEQTDRQAELITGAQRRVADALGVTLDGLAQHPAPTMRLVPLPVDTATAGQLSERLSTEHRIQVPVTSSGDRAFLRIAAGPYNTADDYDRLADAVGEVTRR